MKRFSQLLAIAIAFLLPLYYVRFTLGPLPTNLIEVLVLILVAVTLTSEKRISFPHWQPILLILVGLLAASLIADDQRVAFGIVKGWFVVPLAYYACLATLFAPDERPQLIKPALASAVLVSIYAIGQWLGLIPLLAHQGAAAQQYLDQGRALAFFESPNFLALFLAPLTVLCGGYFWLNKQYRQLAWLALPVVAIGLSQSQGGWLALLTATTWLGLVYAGRSRWWFFILLIDIIVLATFFIITDNASRFLIWKNVWLLVTTNPLLGIGPGQFQHHFSLIGDGSSLFAATLPYALHAHNIFLNFWLSAGLLGIVGFTLLLVRIFRSATRSTLALAALAGLIAVLVHGLVDSAYFKNDLAIIFWLLVFLAGSEYGKQNV